MSYKKFKFRIDKILKEMRETDLETCPNCGSEYNELIYAKENASKKVLDRYRFKGGGSPKEFYRCDKCK